MADTERYIPESEAARAILTDYIHHKLATAVWAYPQRMTLGDEIEPGLYHVMVEPIRSTNALRDLDLSIRAAGESGPPSYRAGTAWIAIDHDIPVLRTDVDYEPWEHWWHMIEQAMAIVATGA